jgi:hypothetical protein
MRLTQQYLHQMTMMFKTYPTCYLNINGIKAVNDMNRNWKNKIVATAIRVELSPKKDQMFLVFEVTDQSFKQMIREDWLQDIDLEIVDKDLIFSKEINK